MGYDLNALAPEDGVEKVFHMGAFSWSPLLEACGYLWPCTFYGGRWFCVFGIDERLGTDYPLVMSNDGFEVTAEEARIMARMARNFVAVQRHLPESHASRGLIDKVTVTRDDLLGALQDAMHGSRRPDPWPVKIREDFVDKYERFAEWAERSGGFAIW